MGGGNSDVVASLVTIIRTESILSIKETSTITQTIAENPITPQETM
jgi:hypothetical protein